MDPNQIGPALIVLAILVLIYLGMAAGWRARKRRQSAFTVESTTPTDAGELLLEVPMLYVATTPANKPLERLALPGLAFRGRGTFLVWQRGVTISINGEPDVYVPVSRIRSIGTSTYAIDRVVESGGLTRLDWSTDLVGSDKARLSAATTGATRREKKAAIAHAVSSAHDATEAFAAAASASAEVEAAHQGDASQAATGAPAAGQAGPAPHSTADIESYLRFPDPTDALRALGTVQSIIPTTPDPTPEGPLA
ncbi:PH-like domain-containing protein [Subtercola sp. YIM 133946]|uniref:PH-like domain-containing protein n=1 Tax=Subtercola sp. YIM 133946 TaxID=3118909 RepID=UPI002F93C4C9